MAGRVYPSVNPPIFAVSGGRPRAAFVSPGTLSLPRKVRGAQPFLSGRCGETVAEHRQPALRLLGGGFVLDDIPVFGEQTIFDPYDVCHYPVGGLPDIPKSTVQHHVVAVRGDQRVLVAHVGRAAFDKSEKTLASRFDVRAVLNVVW